MKKIIILIAVIALFNSCNENNEDLLLDPTLIYECSATTTNNHPNAADFQTFLDQKVSAGLPGISMLIESPEGIWIGAAGKADLEFKVDMEACNVHKIGSTTKTFTAALIFQLYEEGQLDLEDLISAHLPNELIDELPNYESVTIRNLLNHTSGLPNYLDIKYTLNYYDDPTRIWTDEEELSMVYGEDAEFEVGEKANYSNTNFLLLGMIAKKITEKNGGTLYQERIFDPIGMMNTHFKDNGDLPSDLVRGYFEEDGKGNFIDITDRAYARSSMAGGASSTVEDLHQFLKKTWTTNELVSEATKTLITSLDNTPFLYPEKAEYGDENKVNRLLGFGLGWFVYDTDYGVCYAHGGSFDGRRSIMRYFPEMETSVVYLINGSGASINPMINEMRLNQVWELVFN